VINQGDLVLVFCLVREFLAKAQNFVAKSRKLFSNRAFSQLALTRTWWQPGYLGVPLKPSSE
jgi:hypothetical protein